MTVRWIAAVTAFVVVAAALLTTLAATAFECARAMGSVLDAVREEDRRELAEARRDRLDEPHRNGRPSATRRAAAAALAVARPAGRARQ